MNRGTVYFHGAQEQGVLHLCPPVLKGNKDAGFGCIITIIIIIIIIININDWTL